MRLTTDLPYVDTHAQPVRASGADVWAALVAMLRRATKGGGWFARMLRADPARGCEAFSGRPGDTLPGFEVVEAEPGRRLALAGRHRFSVYALTFVLDGGELRAETRAAFPGVVGRLNRAAVIGTGAHRLVVRRMLRQVARRVNASRAARLHH